MISDRIRQDRDFVLDLIRQHLNRPYGDQTYTEQSHTVLAAPAHIISAPRSAAVTVTLPAASPGDRVVITNVDPVFNTLVASPTPFTGTSTVFAGTTRIFVGVDVAGTVKWTRI